MYFQDTKLFFKIPRRLEKASWKCPQVSWKSVLKSCLQDTIYNFQDTWKTFKTLNIVSRRSIIFQDTLTSWKGVLKIAQVSWKSVLKSCFQTTFQDTWMNFQDAKYFFKTLNYFSRYKVNFQDTIIRFKTLNIFSRR